MSRSVSYKPWVKTYGDPKYYKNALAFATEEEAKIWAEDLLMRWMQAEEYEIRPSDEPVNYRMEYVAGEGYRMIGVKPRHEEVTNG